MIISALLITHLFMTQYNLSILQAAFVFLSFFPFLSMFETSKILKYQHAKADGIYDDGFWDKKMLEINQMDDKDMLENEEVKELLSMAEVVIRYLLIIGSSVCLSFFSLVSIAAGIPAYLFFSNKKINKFIFFISNLISFCVFLACVLFV